MVNCNISNSFCAVLAFNCIVIDYTTTGVLTSKNRTSHRMWTRSKRRKNHLVFRMDIILKKIYCLKYAFRKTLPYCEVLVFTLQYIHAIPHCNIIPLRSSRRKCNDRNKLLNIVYILQYTLKADSFKA